MHTTDDDRIECLYLVRFGNMVKVGISSDPWRRMGTLQTATPEVLTLAYLAVTTRRTIAAKWEKQLHRHLGHCHVRGEWFRVDIEDAIEAADQIIMRSMPKNLRHNRRSFTSIGDAMAWADALTA